MRTLVFSCLFYCGLAHLGQAQSYSSFTGPNFSISYGAVPNAAGPRYTTAPPPPPSPTYASAAPSYNRIDESTENAAAYSEQPAPSEAPATEAPAPASDDGVPQYVNPYYPSAPKYARAATTFYADNSSPAYISAAPAHASHPQAAAAPAVVAYSPLQTSASAQTYSYAPVSHHGATHKVISPVSSHVQAKHSVHVPHPVAGAHHHAHQKAVSSSYGYAAPIDYKDVKAPADLAERAILSSERDLVKEDINAPREISQFPAPEDIPSLISYSGYNLVNSLRPVVPPEIASYQPATDTRTSAIDSHFYADKAFKFPIAVTSVIKAVRDHRSPNAAAALAFMKSFGSKDICARSTQRYLEVILNGGSVDEANSAATKIYIDDYNHGLYVTPGSACEASDIAWRRAEAEGRDPVVDSAIAFMDYWPGTHEGNPCAVSGRDYVNAILNGASHTQANFLAAKSFGDAIKALAARNKPLTDPACAAATKAFFNALPSKPSPPNAAAMLAFVDKAFDGFSFKFDPVCWKSTEAFFDSYAAGNDELTSNRKAARVFLTEFAKGGAGIPADSPCAAATRAYYANIPNPPSPANKAAMEAFMDKMIADGPREPDPACAASTVAYWDAYEAGATEADSNLAAAEGFFKAFRDGLKISANSPCVAATKAYFRNLPNKPSPPNAAAMIAFIDAMVAQGNKRVYDPVCAKSTEAFWEAYRAGDDELTANFKANLAFIKEYKKGAKVPAESPCLISTIAYSKATKNLPSPPNNAAMLAFMDEAILSNMDRVDPVCLESAEAYFRAYLNGAGEAKSNEIAGVAFLDAVAATPDFDPGSPCGISAKAYMDSIDLRV